MDKTRIEAFQRRLIAMQAGFEDLKQMARGKPTPLSPISDQSGG